MRRRLLYEHVLPGLAGEDGHERMPVIRSRDADGIDIGVVQHLAEVCVGLDLLVPLLELPHHVSHVVRVAVTHRDYPDPGDLVEVSHIASSAEFTPRNVQTQVERVHMVFAVEISLDNSAGLLRPGMPADAVFEMDER